MVVPTAEVFLVGLGAVLRDAETDGYWAELWFDGGRSGPSLPGSGVELINHFGGMTDCLGGRGSRRVSFSASGSGTKWLSDSMKT